MKITLFQILLVSVLIFINCSSSYGRQESSQSYESTPLNDSVLVEKMFEYSERDYSRLSDEDLNNIMDYILYCYNEDGSESLYYTMGLSLQNDKVFLGNFVDKLKEYDIEQQKQILSMTISGICDAIMITDSLDFIPTKNNEDKENIVDRIIIKIPYEIKTSYLKFSTDTQLVKNIKTKLY